MTIPKTLKAYGYELCPYVQRMVIGMKVARLDFEIEYVDLDNLPEHLLKIAPLGKVPVLLADDLVLYESLVILDFINDMAGCGLHPADPAAKARQGSLMALASELLDDHWVWAMTSKRDRHERLRAKIIRCLNYLESEVVAAPFFHGDRLSMIDIAFAPLLQRLRFNDRDRGSGWFEGRTGLGDWAEGVANLDEVEGSTLPGIDKLLEEEMRRQGGVLADA